MSLAQTQLAFMAQILDDEAPAPDAWGERQQRGMDVYRNNYRSALVEALKSTFERTARWVGEDAFQQAAAHHLITHPPSSWTLDDAGRGFDATCAELFANDPEVAELVWLEWAMHEVFTAPDIASMTREEFANAATGFDEQDWTDMRLQFLPHIAIGVVDHDLVALWNLLASEDFEREAPTPVSDTSCIVWREGERPVFVMREKAEARALTAMIDGTTYGEACATLLEGIAETNEAAQQDAAMRAGAMLGSWIEDGLIIGLLTD